MRRWHSYADTTYPGEGTEAPPRHRFGRRRLAIFAASAAAVVAPLTLSPLGPATVASTHTHIDCAKNNALCTEVVDSEKVFGEGTYVGHDEPSLLFYSNQAGSGNQYKSTLTLPVQPPPATGIGTKVYDFQLHPAFWFGMAMCDTQSYPELVKSCIPDSDLNIVDPAQSPYHPGEAFMEMQFYPPGWVPFQNPGGISCSATQWCAALNIDSLSENPVTGQVQNSTCAARTGLEYVNFAFITKNGVPQAPPNPVDATAATFTPDPSKDVFFNGGDRINVSMHDTSSGLRVDLNDLTSGRSGFMVASSENNFGQVHFDPNGTSCQNIPYNFHPMYSTSSTKTRVTWAAHTYNIAFSDEIGHFDFCSNPQPDLTCKGTEGTSGTGKEPTDSDDFLCWPASASTLIQYPGCANSNVPGFDGSSYLNVWPNGDPNRPTPIQFTSFRTGSSYSNNYTRVAFETDLPRVEQGLNGCDPYAPSGCTVPPITDDGSTAPFYPYYTDSNKNGSCRWVYGNTVPGLTTNNFGTNSQWGTYDTGVDYTGPGGTPYAKADDFRHILSSNPCPS